MRQLPLLKYGLLTAVHPDKLERLMFLSNLVEDINSRKAITLNIPRQTTSNNYRCIFWIHCRLVDQRSITCPWSELASGISTELVR